MEPNELDAATEELRSAQRALALALTASDLDWSVIAPARERLHAALARVTAAEQRAEIDQQHEAGRQCWGDYYGE